MLREVVSAPSARPRLAAAAPDRVQGSSGTRSDIQGLRAVAVVVVVAFHLWPHALTGGYVGVDVFFVISGFLITGHLLRAPVTSPRDLLQFWARRVRRLIPAASVVLLVTLVAAAIWLPATVVGSVGRDVVAAALYIENWNLAASEADYLAAGQLHSPVQHYWSLSIEEQFYILWPVLLAVAGAVGTLAARGRDGGRPRRWAVLVVVGAVTAASLLWSVHLTRTDPAPAYFVSTTRVWELALGGVLAAGAAVLPRGARAVRDARYAGAVRAAIAWLGLLMIAWAALRFDDGTAFPGVAALVPTFGTLLVIAVAADGVQGGPGRVLSLRPVQWLGNASYSIYLWHWPLIVIAPFALGRRLDVVDSLAIVAATLVLAELSRRFVEDRVRWHPVLSRSLRATFGVLAACVLVVSAAAVGVIVPNAAAARHAEADFREAVTRAEPCVGAGVARDPACTEPGFVTPPEVAAEDKPVVYADGCWNNTPFTTRNVCTYGASPAQAASARIALVGNSHAGHWVPALEDALETENWQLTTFLQSVCYTVDRPIEFDGAGISENCRSLNRWAVDSIVSGGYDLVVMSDRTNQPLAHVPPEAQERAAEAAYRETIERFTDAGIPVLVLRDVPAMPSNVPDCIAQHQDDVDACAASPETAVEPDPLASAAAQDPSGQVSVLDVNDVMCDDDLCRPVIGGLIAYFDHGHLTATFARTLAPEVVTAVKEASPALREAG
jgi:peptidoglycan/LPS O-acetylase OafA/YrhL